MFFCQKGRYFSIPSHLQRVAFLVPASKSIPRTQTAVTFSRHCGGRKRGRGPLKEWLKVGDKNKLGKRRKLIIHNRVHLDEHDRDSESKKAIFWLRNFPLCHCRSIYLAEVRDATRNLLMKVNSTTLPFILDSHTADTNSNQSHRPRRCDETRGRLQNPPVWIG